jgi:hypothetical protein
VSARLLTLALLGLATTACGARPPRPPATDLGPVVPMLVLDEAKDEWLHERCTFRGIVSTVDSLLQLEAKQHFANLGEIVYADGAVQHVVLFRCDGPPQWFAGNWPQTDAPPAAAPAATSPTPPFVVAALAPPAPSAPRASAPSKPLEPPRPKAPPKPALGYALVGTGVAALVAGGVTGALVMGAKNDVQAHCTADRTCDSAGLEATSRGRTMSIVSTTLVATGAVAGAVGLYILLSPGKQATAVGARASNDGVSLELGGRF